MATTFLEYLEGIELAQGLGDSDSPCSIAAYNLYATGEMTAKIPDCMSEVVGRWIIRIQDAMPSESRNSRRWKMALSQAPGTGRARERDRAKLILDWMWEVALPQIQPIADGCGFGNAWQAMLEEKTASASASAAYAAAAVVAYAAAAAAYNAAAAAAYAYNAASVASAGSAGSAASAAYDAASAGSAASAASAAYDAAAAAAYDAAASAAYDAARKAFWDAVDPCALLEKLVIQDAG